MHSGMWGLALAVCLAAGTSAFGKNSHVVRLYDSLSVGGTQIAAGEYKINWEGQGASTQVSFAKGNKVVATASAKLVDAGQKHAQNRVDYVEDGKGTAKLTQIHLGGTSQSLVFTQ
jgi:hypothetical protein